MTPAPPITVGRNIDDERRGRSLSGADATYAKVSKRESERTRHQSQTPHTPMVHCVNMTSSGGMCHGLKLDLFSSQNIVSLEAIFIQSSFEAQGEMWRQLAICLSCGWDANAMMRVRHASQSAKASRIVEIIVMSSYQFPFSRFMVNS